MKRYTPKLLLEEFSGEVVNYVQGATSKKEVLNDLIGKPILTWL